jgi:rifampicin phosphotransferase
MTMTSRTFEIPEGFWERESSHCPRPLSALMRSLLPIVNAGFGRMFREMGVLPERLEWREIGGWVYTRVVPPGGKDRPPPPAWLFPVLVRLVPPLRRSVRRATEAQRTDRFGGHLERWEQEWRPELTTRILDLRAVAVADLDDGGLAAHLDDVLALTRQAWGIHFLLHGVNAYVLADLAFTGRELLGWSDGQTLELLVGLSGASTAPGRELAHLTALARRHPTIGSLLEAGELGAVIDSLPEAAPEFAAAFAAYQHRFGFRTIRYEPADPTMEETPAIALRLIADQLRSGFDPDARLPELARRRDAACAQARARLAARPSDLERFERVLRRAERFYPVREDNAPMTFSEPLALIRRSAREIGRRLTDHDGLDGRDDVFHLEIAELSESVGVLADGAPVPDLRPIVAFRQEERAWAEAHPGPPSYGRDPGLPPFHALPPAARFANEALLWLVDRIFAESDSGGRQEGGQSLTGIPASTGRYRGPARLLLSEADFPKLEPGDVLVCPVTSPAWSMLFPNIGGLVTDSGGLLSHPAIIAREFGIPAVVATGNATELLCDGQEITVDGATGRVEVHP